MCLETVDSVSKRDTISISRIDWDKEAERDEDDQQSYYQVLVYMPHYIIFGVIITFVQQFLVRNLALFNLAAVLFQTQSNFFMATN